MWHGTKYLPGKVKTFSFGILAGAQGDLLNSCTVSLMYVHDLKAGLQV
jgi:hypothetical protein